MKRIILVIVIFLTTTHICHAVNIKVRAVVDADGITQVKALINHPMETGARINAKTGETIPAHYITKVNAYWNNNEVLHGIPSPAVSKNPYFSFKFKGATAGDTLEMSWEDNLGNVDSTSINIR